MSEVVLLSNTDRLQQVEKYDRSCTTSTKFWPPSASSKNMSEVILLSILTAFNKFKKYVRACTTSNTFWRLQQVENYARCYSWTLKWAKLFTGFINQYLIDESAALNVSTEPLKTLSHSKHWSHFVLLIATSLLIVEVNIGQLTDKTTLIPHKYYNFSVPYHLPSNHDNWGTY